MDQRWREPLNSEPPNSARRRGLFESKTLLDAATGSRLIECGVDPTRAALEGPERLIALHQADLEAGAEWLTAATFSATESEALREAVSLACSLGAPVMVDDERLCDTLRALDGLPTLASFCPLVGAVHTPVRFLEAGATALGVNCGDDLNALIDAAIELIPLGVNVVMRPSAGVPNEGGVHPVTPAEFGAALGRGWSAGVHAGGGCCGVVPAHLREAAAR